MPLPPHRSLLNPSGVEQLPAYTPRQGPSTDSETASIRSNAPSYVSAAPSYHSSLPPSHLRTSDASASSNTSQAPGTDEHRATRRPALPQSHQYVPGFGNQLIQTSYGTSASSSRQQSENASASRLRSLYNVSEWVPVTEGLQARHYHNVASRRVTETSNGFGNASRALFPALFQPFSEPGGRSRSPENGSPGTNPFERNHNASSSSLVNNPYGESTVHLGTQLARENGTGNATSNEDTVPLPPGSKLPLSPHEDPDLVGEEAAARFRSQRLYMAGQQDVNHSQRPTASSGNASQQQETTPPIRVYQYSSLVSPAVASIAFTPSRDEQQRPQTSNGDLDQPGSQQGLASRPRAATYQSPEERREHDDALRAQESRRWDFMLAQMADWEERDRSWKKYKEQVENRYNRNLRNFRIGPNLATWSSTVFTLRKQPKDRQKGQNSGEKKKNKKKSKIGLTS